MKKHLAVVAIAAGLTGSAVTFHFANEGNAPSYVLAQDGRTPSMTFAPMLRKATPAVVRVESKTRPVRTSSRDRRGNGGNQLPPGMEDFFGQFFGGRGIEPPQERRGGGLGSGVIVTNDGYILTNNHVVEGATDVNVVMTDRREFKAKVVGTDPPSDIAVLKIDSRSLPVLPISDSGRVQVGDVALAIGNPFGLSSTVTMGIVSATGRSTNMRIEQYEDFIQTDASINPGNSGGALVNTDGQLIGINTAILAGGSGGNQGIGFAIPVNMARNIMDQIVKTGKVSRGFMGAGIQDISPDLAKAFNLSSPSGAAITRLEAGGPAEKAGLQVGDVVLSVDGNAVIDSNGLRNRISSTAPNTTVHLKVQRQEGTRDIAINLGRLPDQNKESDDEPELKGGGSQTPLEGVSVDDLTPDVARQLQLPRDAKGVVVTEVDRSSVAGESGLRRGDVITQVNRRNVNSAKDFDQAVRSSKGQVLLLVNREGGTLFVVIDPSRR